MYMRSSLRVKSYFHAKRTREIVTRKFGRTFLISL